MSALKVIENLNLPIPISFLSPAQGCCSIHRAVVSEAVVSSVVGPPHVVAVGVVGDWLAEVVVERGDAGVGSLDVG